jgi:hypothetical protein
MSRAEQAGLLYEALDAYTHAVCRWERAPTRIHAAEVARLADQVLLSLPEDELAYDVFARLAEEWRDAALAWRDEQGGRTC